MPKIARKTASIFGGTAPVSSMEQFASFEATNVANFSNNPVTIMGLNAWSLGWSSAQYQGIFAPYIEDRNAVDFVNSYQIAYLLEMGIPEWDSGTTYYKNSIVQNYGQIFISSQDSNLGNIQANQSSNTWWTFLPFFKRPAPAMTQTVFTGAGINSYTSPVGATRIRVRVQGGGGGGAAAGGSPGGSGGTSYFGSQITCGGGQGAQPSNFSGGIGGTGSLMVNSFGFISNGGDGGAGATFPRVRAGGTKLSNGGEIGPTASHPYPHANTGAGGGGIVSDSAIYGGGGGAYGETMLFPPSNRLGVNIYVGAGGEPGSPYNNSYPAVGASGIIIVDEFYF